MDQSQVLLTDLRKLRKNVQEGCAPTHGICAWFAGRQLTLLDGIMRKWPKFSGWGLFPVPAPNTDPAAAYLAAKAVHKLWDTTTEYGKNRLELLDFCIARLEKEHAQRDTK